MSDFFKWFRKKRIVIKAYSRGTLVLVSYENPTLMRETPIKDIVGIDKIEVTYE